MNMQVELTPPILFSNEEYSETAKRYSLVQDERHDKPCYLSINFLKDTMEWEVRYDATLGVTGFTLNQAVYKMNSLLRDHWIL